MPVISTYHDAETYVGSRSGKMLVKPVCVRDYNATMGGVDLKDQKLSMYVMERKRGVKWYVKMFKRLLNVSIHNAFVAYACSRNRRNMPAETHREFRKDLARALTHVHKKRKLEAPPASSPEKRLKRDIVHVPKVLHGQKSRKRCEVCQRQGKSKRVLTLCETCGEYLCFENCWLKWHTTPILKEQKRGRKRTRKQ